MTSDTPENEPQSDSENEPQPERGQELLKTSDLVTIAITYFTLAVPVTVLHIDAGTQPWLVLVAAFTIVSATATLAFAAITAAGGSVFSGVLGGWLVSTRFGLLAAAVAPRLWPKRRSKAVAAFVVLDPNAALTLNEPPESGTSTRVFTKVSLALVLPWVSGTLLGILIGEYIGDLSTWGFDAMLPALFVAIIWQRLRERRSAAIGASAALVAVLLVEPLPAGLSILTAALMSFAVLLPPRRSRRRNGDSEDGSNGDSEDGSNGDS